MGECSEETDNGKSEDDRRRPMPDIVKSARKHEDSDDSCRHSECELEDSASCLLD